MKTIILTLCLIVCCQSHAFTNTEVIILNDLSIVSRTLYAEAGGEPIEGIIAVAGVIGNRSALDMKTPRQTCLKRRAFSCWNKGVIKKPKSTARYQFCIKLAKMLIDGKIRNCFTHYYAYKSCRPSWDVDLKNKTIIGNHLFGVIRKI